jgi:hypothetical protein
MKINWHSLPVIILFVLGIFCFLYSIFWILAASKSPFLTSYRKFIWPIVKTMFLKRFKKMPSIFTLPLLTYLTFEETPKERYIQNGWKDFTLDLQQQISLIADKLTTAYKEAELSVEQRLERYLEDAEKYHELHKDDKLFQSGFSEEEIDYLRETMTKIKQQKDGTM